MSAPVASLGARSSAAASAKNARLCAAFSAAAVLFAAASARAQAGPPAGHNDDAFDIMNLLAHDGLHDIKDERWNAYGQFTYISSWKLPFSAPYTNANGSTNSLLPDSERSFTGSFTLFVGLRLWPGAEAYAAPEIISERPLSQLRGLGGSIQNFELQKTGGETPQLYRSRTFLRQTIDLGGAPVGKTSDPMQLGATVSPNPIPRNGASSSTITVCVKDAASNTVTTANDVIGLAFTSTTGTAGARATTGPDSSPKTASGGCAVFTVTSTTNPVAADTYTASDTSRTVTGTTATVTTQ